MKVFFKIDSFLLNVSEKKCDGIFHCLHGEDETYEECKINFPEEATIECIENRVDGIDLKIKAVSCDGIRECRSGEDEECKPSEIVLYACLFGFYLVTVLIWCWIRYDVQKQPQTIETNEDFDCRNCREFMGDQLANFKVRQ